MNFQFYVDVNDGEIAIIEANNLKEAQGIFSELHTDDVDKVCTITNDCGYEYIRGI